MELVPLACEDDNPFGWSLIPLHHNAFIYDINQHSHYKHNNNLLISANSLSFFSIYHRNTCCTLRTMLRSFKVQQVLSKPLLEKRNPLVYVKSAPKIEKISLSIEIYKKFQFKNANVF